MNRKYKKIGLVPFLHQNNAENFDFSDASGSEEKTAKIKASLPGFEKTNFDYKDFSSLDKYKNAYLEKKETASSFSNYSDVYGLPIFDPRPEKNGQVIGHYKLLNNSKNKYSDPPGIPGDLKLEPFYGDQDGQIFIFIHSNPDKYIEAVISLNRDINIAFFETQNGLTDLDINFVLPGEGVLSNTYRKNKFIYKSWAGNHDAISIFINDNVLFASAVMGNIEYNKTDSVLPVVGPPLGCLVVPCTGTVPPSPPPPSQPPPSTAIISQTGIVSVLEELLLNK